jgi:hypothetical protein
MLTGKVGHVIGVDTHRDTITAAILDAVNGGVTQQWTSGTQRMDYRRTLAWAEQHTAGRRAWAIEGAGSYGAGLTVGVRAHVSECVRPDLSVSAC